MLKKQILLLCLVVLAGTMPAGAASVNIPEPALFPSLISGLRIKPPLDFCGEPVPLDNLDVRERLEKAMLLSMWDRAQVILWIKRSGRYMPYIERMLKQNGMPDDLKYVAIVESALRPNIGSSKGAVGFWQFIRSTGRRYGLRIDGNIDERRNLFDSTRAAIAYLKKLHGDFNSWTLAAAAYNMGEHGLGRRIEAQRTRDYYNLYLPEETEFYIPKILAAKLILSDLTKYGFHLTREDLYPPLQFDRVQIDVPARVPLILIAEAAGTYYKTIRDMNPHIRDAHLPGGKHSILIPQGAAQGFEGRFQKIYDAQMAKKSNRKRIIHTVRKGDYLSGIAERYGVSLSDLLRWNNLNRNSHIHPGNRLVILK